MIAWMAYAVAVGVLVAGAAWAGERLLASLGRPTRHPWILALAAAALIPMAGQERSIPTEAPVHAEAAAGPMAESAPTVTHPADIGWDRAAALAWLTLSAAGLLLIVVVQRAVAAARGSWKRERLDGLDVLVSPNFGPALVGVTRPSIVLPGWALALGRRAASIIVRHEYEHRRGGDHLTLLYGGLVVALFPWNPAVWWMLGRLRTAVEIDCDRRTLDSGVTVAEYGRTLLEVGHRPGRKWAFGLGLTESRSLLERRLRTMGRRGGQRSGVAGLGLGALSVLLLLVACETPAPTDIQDALEGVVSVRAEGGAGGSQAAGPAAGITSSGDTVFVMGKAVVYPGNDPLVFIDDELIPPRTDGESFDPRQALEHVAPWSIERVEVVKGEAARQLLGVRGGRAGAIFIYLKDRPPGPSLSLTPRFPVRSDPRQ